MDGNAHPSRASAYDALAAQAASRRNADVIRTITNSSTAPDIPTPERPQRVHDIVRLTTIVDIYAALWSGGYRLQFTHAKAYSIMEARRPARPGICCRRSARWLRGIIELWRPAPVIASQRSQ